MRQTDRVPSAHGAPVEDQALSVGELDHRRSMAAVRAAPLPRHRRGRPGAPRHEAERDEGTRHVGNTGGSELVIDPCATGRRSTVASTSKRRGAPMTRA